MKMLSTIQKREKLNDIYIAGEKGNGGAYHSYLIRLERSVIDKNVLIEFQNGQKNEKDSVSGVLDTDLLEIVRHRLQCFQTGDYKCKENEQALNHIEEALMWLNKRVEDRIERRVLGTNEK